MEKDDKRRYPRTGSHNLVAYVCRDEDSQVASEGMGRTLNVSEGGILLETHTAVDPSYTVSLTLALEDELMDIKGKIAYSKKRMDGKYETGIQFFTPDDKKIRLLRQFITIFSEGMDAPV